MHLSFPHLLQEKAFSIKEALEYNTKRVIIIWPFVLLTIDTYLRGIRKIWWTVIAKGGGYLFFCTGRYSLIRRFDQRVRISQAFEDPSAKSCAVCEGRTAEGHEFSFSPNYSVHQATGGWEEGRKRGDWDSVFNEIYGCRGPFVRANWRSGPGDKDPMPRIEKSIEKKRIARGILRR